MKLRKAIFLVVALTASTLLMHGQKNISINGYVRDGATGEDLIGANIVNMETYKGTSTNNYGFYSVKMPEGKVKLQVSYLGYETKLLELNLKQDTTLNITLRSNTQLEEIVVTANKNDFVRETQMSQVILPITQIKKMPVLLGEVDVLKSIQLLPGVQSGNEGSSGVFVRGGSADQNLILLDGVPVYNVNHLFGFFSVFNADAINHVKIIKGGFPARYGGRLSSVIEIRMKEGNMKELEVDGSIGLLSSKLTISAPIIKDKTSFIISGRRSYFDLFGKLQGALSGKPQSGGYYFGDLNAKINHKFSDKDRIFLSAYTGRDKFKFKIKDDKDEYKSNVDMWLKWGNITSALRWNHIYNKNLFSNVTATYSRYKFENDLGYEFLDKTNNYKFKENNNYSSGIEDYAIKTDWDYFISNNNKMRFGAEYIYHTYSPGISTNNTQTSFIKQNTKTGEKDISSHEVAAYIEEDLSFLMIMKANIGLRFSGLNVKGKNYFSLEPRVALKAGLSDNFSLKGSFSMMNQYLHLLTNSAIGLPTDLWVPVTEKLKPQNSTQYAFGANYQTSGWQITTEAFYKTMDNVIEYKEGASFMPSDENWQNKITTGKGWSYGWEVYVVKDWKKTNFNFAYTLSWSWREFDELNKGEKYPYKYDRRHDIAIGVTHNFNKKVDVAVNWIFSTGNAFTLPKEKYIPATGDGINDYDSDAIQYFDSRNNYRAPSYHRLDIGVNFKKKTKWGHRTWSVGIYNAYGRQNPAFLYVKTKNNDRQALTQISLLRFVPFINYSFKF
ncbi:MAG: TonB-dependent receptor [Bacteroidales bacterium]|jgi:outer membrane cobalamin receptor|nr:TonB-dependent receptor [Bacteroidales bacterium]